jgi:hypothetical protein
MTYDGNLKYVNYATVEPSTGNIAGGNLSTSGTLSVTGNITGGNITTAGVLKISGALSYIDVAGTGFIQNGGTGEFQLSTANATQPLKISTNSASKNWFFYANGDMTAPGNITAGNVSATTFTGALSGAATSATTAGTVTTNAQPNITSVGTLTSISVSGNANVGNLGTAGLIVATGNVTGGNLVTSGNLSVTGNANIGNLGTTTAIITTGNITTINSGLLQNGNSNITITSNGNVSIQSAGSNVELVVTSTGANVTGTFNATGTVTGSYLISTLASGNEGGEISLAQPPNGNLSGGITIDAYQNTLRMFEQGGTSRGLSVDIANSPAGGGTAIGYRDIPQVAAGNVTLAATDAGKHYYSTTAGNLTLTIPLNSTVPFTTGTAISIVVQAAGNILVNAASGVTLYMAGNSTAANRVVGGYGMATLMKVASDTWFINGAGVA